MFQRKMLQMLVGVALCGAVPDGVGSVPKMGFKFDKDHVKSWSEEGKKAGAYARDIFQSAESSVITMLLEIADVIAGSPSQEDFLTGYASAWTNKDTGKSRKTDARAVFDAFARKETDEANSAEFQYERIVGYETDEKTGELKKLDGMPIPIKETKSAKEWLKQYEGDFKGFLSLAREVRNAGSGRQSQGTGMPDHRSRKKVTDKQFAGIVEALPVASMNQAHTVVQEATKALSKMPGFEKVLVNQMELICNQLKTSKIDFYRDAAVDMIDTLNTLRDNVGKMEAHAAQLQAAAKAQSGTSAKSDFVSAPVPAQKAA